MLASTSACGGSDSSAPKTETTYAADDTLAPQPLAERTKVTIAASAPVEVNSVPFLAQAFDEFDRENLDVTFEPSLLTADAIGLLEAGSLDAVWGSVGGALLNSISNGVDVKIVAASGATGVGESQEGYWASKELLAGMPESLNKVKVGSAIGAGASTVPVLARWLKEHGGDIKNVEFVQIPSADVGAAMENGAVDMGTIGVPYERQFSDSNKIG
ncbi:ABC transporter substrate-binding protein [Aeromicrobium sp. UC242_57]|uniref:ABC transporter substrate-binding protein n=1 Tax=Aeromicrobium sp. UC242_57 TaxID=3374624 RepID=UPI00378BCCDB